MEKITKETIKFADFQKLDIRIGTVTDAQVPTWSHWVMKLTVDFGSEIGSRTIFAGIMHFYKKEDLIGNQFPFVINLEPKKIGPEGDFSQGMMLAATKKRKKPLVVEGEEIVDEPILISPKTKVEKGSLIR